MVYKQVNSAPWPPHEFRPGVITRNACDICARVEDHPNHSVQPESCSSGVDSPDSE